MEERGTNIATFSSISLVGHVSLRFARQYGGWANQGHWVNDMVLMFWRGNVGQRWGRCLTY